MIKYAYDNGEPVCPAVPEKPEGRRPRLLYRKCRWCGERFRLSELVSFTSHTNVHARLDAIKNSY